MKDTQTQAVRYLQQLSAQILSGEIEVKRIDTDFKVETVYSGGDIVGFRDTNSFSEHFHFERVK